MDVSSLHADDGAEVVENVRTFVKERFGVETLEMRTVVDKKKDSKEMIVVVDTSRNSQFVAEGAIEGLVVNMPELKLRGLMPGWWFPIDD